ncbi:FAD-dependent monooxygenase [Mycolicibacterium komossense]|uniref:FAD-dependent monooxygenase n=1 Tax=Mycolicibacterium komossense TaxID=1779 RepID=A0ABT3CH69_9MYCO|nr:FAD-dependent monooxygenase [Mycolicibacterium komossense]MCV7228803.1 FAD-dependent monooxygenase [Mycolicibacterium komossense]
MRILVSGAGMAGLSAGISLGATGHDVTVIERAHHLRTNGSPIDIRGRSLEITSAMGILDQIKQHRVSMTEQTRFIDDTGTVIAKLPLGVGVANDSMDDIEIPREDLALILRNAMPPSTTLIFDESIKELVDQGDGVDVTFTSGRQDRFDIVVGADGLHSLTRRLVFGPESSYLQHLGLYVALTTLPPESVGEQGILNWPGHMIGIVSYRTTTLGIMNFRSPWLDYDYRDLDAQKQILLKEYAGHSEWRVPEILDSVRKDGELYFDSISQIHMPSWHHGRIVLVGDAAHCASPLSGRGTAAAILGTSALADALLKHPDDIAAAFQDYEADHRPYVSHAQTSATPGGDLLVPLTQADLDARNTQLREVTA